MPTILKQSTASTEGQTLDAQIGELKAAGATKLFAEEQSGARGDRPQLRKAIAALGEGDVLIVTRLDRLARSTRDLLNVLHEVAVGIIAGLVGWINQQYLNGLYYWFSHVRSFVLTAQDERMLKPREAFSECVKTDGDYSKYCPQMVVVPANKFTMGLASAQDLYQDEGPQHEVTIVRPFAVSKFEVTFDQWDACIQYGVCGRLARPYGGGKQPAINVSWDDAEEYVKWLSWLTGQSYRLLTEAEWEYAARAGNTGPFSFEGDGSALGEYAWYFDNSANSTHPVGGKKPNAFGVHDMHGNVWEWVEDCYHKSYDGAPTDGSAWTTGDCDGRVIRGGSWVNQPENLRSASRVRETSDNRSTNVGFRVGRTLFAGTGAIMVAPGAH
jgi:formylglycine-generating enzyme required for sulfatase activity